MWSWGKISATMLQWLASGAAQDGLHHPSVVAMANIGGGGEHVQNMRRDLVRQHFPTMRAPKPKVVNVPLLDKYGNPQDRGHLMLSPLDVAQRVYDLKPALMSTIVGADLSVFWDNVKADDPRWEGHTWLRDRTDSWQTKAIPIVLHGDSAVFTTRGEQSMFALNWRGLLAPRFASNVFPVWCHAKASMTEEANSRLWRRFVHLFNSGQKGKHPLKDENGCDWPIGSSQALWAGKPLCDGNYCFVLWNVAADLEYIANDLKLPHHGANEPCFYCPASRSAGSPTPITDCRKAATWKAHLISPAVGAAVHPTDHWNMEIDGASRWIFKGIICIHSTWE